MGLQEKMVINIVILFRTGVSIGYRYLAPYYVPTKRQTFTSDLNEGMYCLGMAKIFGLRTAWKIK
jgi:hypothetical protein